MELEQRCPMCGVAHVMDLSNAQSRQLFEYRGKGMLIQEAFPELNRVEREFIKTGYCPKCQELIFGDGETSKVYRSEE